MVQRECNTPIMPVVSYEALTRFPRNPDELLRPFTLPYSRRVLFRFCFGVSWTLMGCVVSVYPGVILLCVPVAWSGKGGSAKPTVSSETRDFRRSCSVSDSIRLTSSSASLSSRMLWDEPNGFWLKNEEPEARDLNRFRGGRPWAWLETDSDRDRERC